MAEDIYGMFESTRLSSMIITASGDEILCNFIEGQFSGGAGIGGHARNMDELSEKLKRRKYFLVLFDSSLPGAAGRDILSEIKDASPYSEVIIISGNRDISHAVNCVKQGAFDYLLKPFAGSMLLSKIEKAYEAYKHYQEMELLKTCDVGRLVLNGYNFVRPLASGRNSDLFVVENGGLYYALKKYRSEIYHKSEYDKIREFLIPVFETAVQIEHQNVVRTFDFSFPEEGEGLPFVLMEYLDARPMSEYIGLKCMAVPQKLEILRQAAAGLREIHRHGIIHRDIKPDNIMICQDMSVKISDFCVSAVTDGINFMNDGIFGSPAYMAPEAFERNSAPGTERDIFSFGVMTYEFLCGKRPFCGSEIKELRRSITNETPVRPSSLNSELSQALDGIIMSTLQKEMYKRPSAQELSAAFDYLCEKKSASDISGLDVFRRF